MENARDQALEEAASYAEFYAAERMTMVGDTILHDPVLAGGRRTAENLAVSRDMTINGTIHSSAYHAAMDVAKHLRSMKSIAARDEGEHP